jgi:stress-induced morphogen
VALRDQVCELLQQSFPDGEVSVEEWGGAGDHLAARVRSSRFAGLALRRQHELVYEPVRHLIDDGSIHALKIKTEAKP